MTSDTRPAQGWAEMPEWMDEHHAEGWLIPSGTYSEPDLVTDAGQNPAPRKEHPMDTRNETVAAEVQPLTWEEGGQEFARVARTAEESRHDREMFVTNATIEGLVEAYRNAEAAERHLDAKRAQLAALRHEIVQGLRHFADQLDPQQGVAGSVDRG